MLEARVFRKRVEYLQQVIQNSRADFALFTPSPNFLYLTGIARVMRERLIALVIQAEAEPAIIAPQFEISTFKSDTWVDRFIPWAEDEDPYQILADVIQPQQDSINGLFDDQLPLGVYWAIRDVINALDSSMSITPVLRQMRIRKSEAELALMKQAGHVIDAAVMHALRFAHLGISELELKKEVEDEIVRQKANPTFAAIQFGENSALPHAESGSRQLAKGDVLLLDCGCSIGGYNTDMTRVAVLGAPSNKQEKVHGIVRQAEEVAISQLRPGVTCEDADNIARTIINENGYGEYFTHRLGHGIGLEVHEPPYLVAGNSMPLMAGMIHSVEPGIYLEGQFGIRIEDLVCITEHESEVLTYSPKDLYVIDG